MVEMYVTAVQYGWMEFKTVPDHWKAQVLKGLQAEVQAGRWTIEQYENSTGETYPVEEAAPTE